MMIIRVTKPADVSTLPWSGNHADDAPLFALVDQYLAQEPDRAKRYEAERAATLLGMGEELPAAMPADYS